MTSSVTCAVCGARMKADRVRCLRCEVPLRAALADVPGASHAGSSDSSRNVWLTGLVVGAGLCGILAVLLVLRPTTEKETPRLAGGTLPNPSGPEPAHTPQTPPAETAAADRAPSGAPSIDSARSGGAALAAGDLPAAKSDFEQAIAQNPDDPGAVNGLGLVLERLGDVEGAVARFERAVSLGPEVWSYRFNLAHAWGRLSNWQRAAEEYREAVRLFPDDYATAFNLALAMHHQGKDEAAIPEFERAIRLAPGDATFYTALGNSFQKVGRLPEARRAFERYLALAPQAPDAARIRQLLDAWTTPSAGSASR